MELIEYKVRPADRFIVTRFESKNEDGGAGRVGSRALGEFHNQETAHAVAYALCKAEHERLGWPVDDERIQYPKGIEGTS